MKCIFSELRFETSLTPFLLLSPSYMNQWMSRSRLTCAGGGVAFTQLLRQFGHFAAYRFVAAQETIFRDGVILGSSKRPVIILLREGGGGGGGTKKNAVTHTVQSGVCLLENENLAKKPSQTQR